MITVSVRTAKFCMLIMDNRPTNLLDMTYGLFLVGYEMQLNTAQKCVKHVRPAKE